MSIIYNFTGDGILIGSASLTGGIPTGSVTRFILEGSGSEGDNFQLRIPSGSAGGTEDVIALFITSSEGRPLVGVGTDTPQTSFDVKEQLNNSTGVELLIRNARTATKEKTPVMLRVLLILL